MLFRSGLEAAVTPIEPGWSGFITIELYNKSGRPIRVQSGIGIMQLIFLNSGKECMADYANNSGGKYQDQPPIPVPPRLYTRKP